MLAQRREGAREGVRAAARPRRAVGRRRAGVGAGEEVGIAFTISVSAARGAQGGRRDV